MGLFNKPKRVFLSDVNEKDLSLLRENPEKFGEKVDIIGYKAFEGLQTLTEIYIPDSIKEINDKAFYGCGKLQKVRLPSIPYIGTKTFQACQRLTEIKIPSSVKYIGFGAFEGCIHLKNVEIEDGVKEIYGYAFCDCIELEKISIPRSVERISENVFDGCRKLRKIEFHEGLRTIDENAFNGCESLEEITIPSSVKVLYNDPFSDCKNLKKITFSNRAFLPKYAEEMLMDFDFSSFEVNGNEVTFIREVENEKEE